MAAWLLWLVCPCLPILDKWLVTHFPLCPELLHMLRCREPIGATTPPELLSDARTAGLSCCILLVCFFFLLLFDKKHTRQLFTWRVTKAKPWLICPSHQNSAILQIRMMMMMMMMEIMMKSIVKMVVLMIPVWSPLMLPLELVLIIIRNYLTIIFSSILQFRGGTSGGWSAKLTSAIWLC